MRTDEVNAVLMLVLLFSVRNPITICSRIHKRRRHICVHCRLMKAVAVAWTRNVLLSAKVHFDAIRFCLVCCTESNTFLPKQTMQRPELSKNEAADRVSGYLAELVYRGEKLTRKYQTDSQIHKRSDTVPWHWLEVKVELLVPLQSVVQVI